tara:strand:+ start:7602 stop:8252 length:651 start_codon:yes stop_codon:yes gene_type:complete
MIRAISALFFLVTLSLNVSCQINKHLFTKAFSLDSTLYGSGNAFNVIVRINARKSTYDAIVNFGQLRYALSKKLNIPIYSHEMNNHLINNYESGYNLNSKHFGIHLVSSYKKMDSLQNTDAFKSITKRYIDDKSSLQRIEKYMHIKDSAAIFLEDDYMMDSLPYFDLSSFDFHDFIQIMWANGFLLIEGHNKVLNVADFNRFCSKFRGGPLPLLVL